MAVRLQVFGGIDLELAASDDLLGLLVGTQVREIGLHEIGIVPSCLANTCLLVFGCPGEAEIGGQDQPPALFPCPPSFFTQSVLSHC